MFGEKGALLGANGDMPKLQVEADPMMSGWNT
jgi:hypothetical protein